MLMNDDTLPVHLMKNLMNCSFWLTVNLMLTDGCVSIKIE